MQFERDRGATELQSQLSSFKLEYSVGKARHHGSEDLQHTGNQIVKSTGDESRPVSRLEI